MFVEGKNEIQEVIAIQEQIENQIIHKVLMESAPHNKYQSSEQVYSGVGNNCKETKKPTELTEEERDNFRIK
ncbi:hypothetical protein AB1K32_27025 [Metabacillus dongyingensis]|uniref:hypothetical protein n=1 Tax=Metabacillus dongyingensis TaxID=2874282 RepID=UPI003B8AFC6C